MFARSFYARLYAVALMATAVFSPTTQAGGVTLDDAHTIGGVRVGASLQNVPECNWQTAKGLCWDKYRIVLSRADVNVKFLNVPTVVSGVDQTLEARVDNDIVQSVQMTFSPSSDDTPVVADQVLVAARAKWSACGKPDETYRQSQRLIVWSCHDNTVAMYLDNERTHTVRVVLLWSPEPPIPLPVHF